MTELAGREHGILFQGWKVRAIREGRATQTRRVVISRLRGRRRELPPGDTSRWYFDETSGQWMADAPASNGGTRQTVGWMPCPYGRPGDLLWVRETHYRWTGCNDAPRDWRRDPRGVGSMYESRGYIGIPEHDALYERAAAAVIVPSIHMPRWACRLILRLTDVRVQRIQEISAQDAVAEGLPPLSLSDGGVGEFRRGWDCINAKRPGCGWEDNPWVWALTFEKVTA